MVVFCHSHSSVYCQSSAYLEFCILNNLHVPVPTCINTNAKASGDQLEDKMNHNILEFKLIGSS